MPSPRLTQDLIARDLRDPGRSDVARLIRRDHQVGGLAWIRYPATDSFVFSYRPRGLDSAGFSATYALAPGFVKSLWTC